MTRGLRLTEPEVTRPMHPQGPEPRPVVITGGAGFVGCNLAARLLAERRRVVILDNLSRRGVGRNVAWLREEYGDALDLHVADVRNREAVFAIVHGASSVFHLAAQVAVTTSLMNPAEDFCINATGTLNVLEAVRAQDDPPPLIYTSTNKVYGELEDIALRATALRYQPTDTTVARTGVGEARPLAFRTPYGCSKGAADQYVRDYARCYDLPTVVFRMSCVYGPRQFGNEDQGWLAHVLICALDRQPIMIYGDGRQVRDALFVDDLVDALVLAERHAERLKGGAFNIGGGPRNTISLLELIDQIEGLTGERPDIAMHDWRTGDQRYYVSDTRRFQRATGWSPRVDLDFGIRRLYEWLVESRDPTDLALVAGSHSTAMTHAMRSSGAAARHTP